MTIEDEQAAAAVLAGVVALDDDVQPPDHVQAAFAAMQAESRQALRDGRPQPTLPSVTRLIEPAVTVEVMPGVVIRPGDVLLLASSAVVSEAQAATVRAQAIERMPALADVVFLSGCTVAGVYRTEES